MSRVSTASRRASSNSSDVYASIEKMAASPPLMVLAFTSPSTDSSETPLRPELTILAIGDADRAALRHMQQPAAFRQRSSCTVMNKAGGSGQWGNAVNVFRADNVIVRGNRIRNAAFTAVRGNAASNLQIVGNTCSGLGEVALYAFDAVVDDQGAVVARRAAPNQDAAIAGSANRVAGNLEPARPDARTRRAEFAAPACCSTARQIVW